MSGGIAMILTMLEQHRLGMRVSVEEADKFGTAIAAKAGDADLIIIHCCE